MRENGEMQLQLRKVCRYGKGFCECDGGIPQQDLPPEEVQRALDDAQNAAIDPRAKLRAGKREKDAKRMERTLYQGLGITLPPCEKSIRRQVH